MRPGTKANIVQRLQSLSDDAHQLSEQLQSSYEGPPFGVSVGWGADGVSIMFDNRPVPRGEVEVLAAECIWALFESIRPSLDPSCPKTFDAVLALIAAKAGTRCHQAPRPPIGTDKA